MIIKTLGCSGGVGGAVHATSMLVDDYILIDAGTGGLIMDELLTIDPIFIGHSYLVEDCFYSICKKKIDPLRMNVSKAAHSLYLFKGNLGLLCEDGDRELLRGDISAANYTVNAGAKIKQSITDIEIMRIDMDLLNIIMTRDKLSDNNNINDYYC